METLIKRTLKAFLAVGGGATVLILIYAFAPELAITRALRLSWDVQYTVLIRHWGLMVALVGGLLLWSIWRPSLLFPAMVFSTVEKAFMVFLYFSQLNQPWISGFSSIGVIDVLIVLYSLVYFGVLFQKKSTELDGDPHAPSAYPGTAAAPDAEQASTGRKNGEKKNNRTRTWINRKTVGIFAILVTALILAGVVFYKPVTNALMQQTVALAMNKQNVHFDDGLYAALCGTGSPMADANRAGPCVAIVAGSHFFIVDAGEGSTKNILLMKLPIGQTDAILLTHYHSDHIADLGEIELQRWVGGSNKTPVSVIGPTGVEAVVAGFNTAYQLDAGYRVAHHGPETAPPSGAGGIAKPFELSAEPDASAVVYDQDGVKITAFKVDHRPVVPAVGYRIDYQGRSVVVSGDTAYSESLMEHAKGADLLFHEALNTDMVQLINDNAGETGSPSLAKVTHDIPSYHSTPEDAAKIAAGAGVRQLVYYHIIPPLPSPILKNLFIGDARNYYSGPITMGEDGMLFFLPANSTRIDTKNILK